MPMGNRCRSGGLFSSHPTKRKHACSVVPICRSPCIVTFLFFCFSLLSCLLLRIDTVNATRCTWTSEAAGCIHVRSCQESQNATLGKKLHDNNYRPEIVQNLPSSNPFENSSLSQYTIPCPPDCGMCTHASSLEPLCLHFSTFSLLYSLASFSCPFPFPLLQPGPSFECLAILHPAPSNHLGTALHDSLRPICCPGGSPSQSLDGTLLLTQRPHDLVTSKHCMDEPLLWSVPSLASLT